MADREGTDTSAATTSAAAALQPAANWQYQALSRKSADIATALAANRLAGILAGHLKARGIIGQPVFEQATNYAVDVTEYTRVQYLVTAVLTKTKYSPQCYHDFIEVLELDGIRPDTEAARSLFPWPAAMPPTATTTSSSAREVTELTTVDDYTEQNIMVIQGKFAKLLQIVREYLQKKMKKSKINNLRQFILQLFPDISPDLIPNSSDVNEIFEAVRRNRLWSYMNYFPLEQIVKQFCGDNPEMTREVENFKKDRAGFQLATKIKKYIPAAKAREHEQLNPVNADHFTQLSLKLDECVADYSLKYLEELWQSLSFHMQLPPIHLLFEMIDSGSIQIVFLIPTKLVPQVVHQAQYCAYFYRMHYIHSVTVGNNCIYGSLVTTAKKHEEERLLRQVIPEEESLLRQVIPKEEPKIGQTRVIGRLQNCCKILLIGEIGSGKTSLLNLLYNCSLIQELGFAKGAAQFRNFNDIELENGLASKMESKTSGVKLYNVELCGLNMGVIDTPGFGGSRGIEEDERNVRRIIDTLKEEEYLNCVCLIINGRRSRMGATLRYVLTEIASILPREIVENVIVVFTNTAGPRYLSFDPKSLQPFFGREIEPERIFCIENPYCRFEKAKQLQGMLPSLKKSFEDTSRTLTEMSITMTHFQRVYTYELVPDGDMSVPREWTFACKIL